MFTPFLVAAAVATTFSQLGAMSVKIGFLTLALKAQSPTAVALLAIVPFVRGRRGAQR